MTMELFLLRGIYDRLTFLTALAVILGIVKIYQVFFQKRKV